MYDLVRHLEEISDTFVELMEKEAKEETEAIEEGWLSRMRIMELCFALLDGMVVEIKGEIRRA